MRRACDELPVRYAYRRWSLRYYSFSSSPDLHFDIAVHVLPKIPSVNISDSFIGRLLKSGNISSSSVREDPQLIVHPQLNIKDFRSRLSSFHQFRKFVPDVHSERMRHLLGLWCHQRHSLLPWLL